MMEEVRPFFFCSFLIDAVRYSDAILCTHASKWETVTMQGI